MSELGGYLFIFDEGQRTFRLQDRIELNDSFTDTISAPDMQLRDIAMCFLSFDNDQINYASLIRRGRKVATAKYVVEFFDFVIFHEPIEFSEIEVDIEAKFRQHFIRSTSGNGYRVPYNTWVALVNSIKRLRPEHEDELDHLDNELKSYSRRDLSAYGFELKAHEKDAVGLALEVFDFDRDKNLSQLTHYTEDQLAPFLANLSKSRILEDTMINHDASIFGTDWSRINPYVIGAVEFQKRNGEKITIVNANRNAIETTLGVDLLYYHHRYRSFVLVQYKRMTHELEMERESETSIETSKIGYRPKADKSYLEEIKRMRDFESEHSDISQIAETEAYRLHPKPFYFKLCPAVTFNPKSTELIQGMYLPLDYWEILINSPNVRGKFGGISINYGNVGRHVNNTLFVQLVQAGWIGSRLENTQVLTNIVAHSLETNKSVIVAYTSGSRHN